MYRVYIRYYDQRVSEMFNSRLQSEALERFETLVNDSQYDDQKCGAVLSYNNRQLAFHRFDKPAGSAHNLRGRLDEIEMPKPTGRPATGVVRKNISISPEIWTRACEIGDGNASAGIAIAIAKFAAD